MRKALILCALLLPVVVLGAVQSGTVTCTYDVVAPSKPAAALAAAGAGLCTNGAHYIKVAYVTASGISTLSAASDAVTVADKTSDGIIAVTLVASSNASVATVNIYMTKAGGSTYYLASSGNANANGAVNVSVADASLTSAAPSTDTSAVDTVIAAGAGRAFLRFSIRNRDSTNPVYMTLDGSTVNTSTSYYIKAGEEFAWWIPQPGTAEVTAIHLRYTSAVTVSYVALDE